VLIRHAKAGEAATDIDRPLTEKGSRAAAAIGAWLARKELNPDLVLVSPARRAQQTWGQAAEALEGAPEPVVERRIYENTVESLLEAIGEGNDDVQILVVVGHNPSIGTLAFALEDGEGDPNARSQLADGFPTGAVAVFECALPFDDLRPDTATLTDFAVPGD
jgi:phosphohistidine phosphatase